MAGIYEARRWDGLRCRFVRIKVHKDRFRHSEVNWGGGGLETHWQQSDHISLLSFFFNWAKTYLSVMKIVCATGRSNESFIVDIAPHEQQLLMWERYCTPVPVSTGPTARTWFIVGYITCTVCLMTQRIAHRTCGKNSGQPWTRTPWVPSPILPPSSPPTAATVHSAPF
jgi:hypothetical protein